MQNYGFFGVKILGLDQYIGHAIENLDRPVPGCIHFSDRAVAKFMQSWQGTSEEQRSLTMFFLAWRCLRSSYLTSLMGMSLEAAAIQRQALEALVYGSLFTFNPEQYEVWKSRHEDPMMKAKFRRTGWKDGLDYIKEKDGELHRIISRVYDALIDLGAHPNILSTLQMSTYQYYTEEKVENVQYLHLSDDTNVSRSHVNTALIYNILMRIMALAWPDQKMTPNLLNDRDKARSSLNEFIEFVVSRNAEAL
jgi:hypothetical protein